MKKIPKRYLIGAAAAPFIFAACGGSGSSSSAPSTANYNFVIPQLNSQRVYAETIVDDSSNTINLSFTETVTAVNDNGTYQVLRQDPSNNSITINGTNYSIQPVVTTYNGSGQAISSMNNSTKVSCTYAPFGQGVTYPTEIGDSFSGIYNETCGTTTIVNTQSGTVASLQSVTVPAGTFQTLLINGSVSFTDTLGIVHGQSISTYRDVSTGALIEYAESDNYSPNPTVGYPTKIAIELVSKTP